MVAALAKTNIGGFMKNILLIGLSFILLQGGCAKRLASSVKGTDPSGPTVAASSLRPPKLTEEKMTREVPLIQESEIEVPVLAPAPEPVSEAKMAQLTDIFFDFDQALLSDSAKTTLQKNAGLIKGQISPKTIQITGHSDERGTEEYNLALGERRAKIVKRYLTALGVNAHLLQTTSLGEEAPFCNQAEEGCWSQNRRAHFSVRPPQ